MGAARANVGHVNDAITSGDVDLARVVLGDAPPETASLLNDIRAAVRELVWLGAPSIAITSALVVGRAEGEARRDATAACVLDDLISGPSDSTGGLPVPDMGPLACTSSDHDVACDLDLGAFAGLIALPEVEHAPETSRPEGFDPLACTLTDCVPVGAVDARVKPVRGRAARRAAMEAAAKGKVAPW